MESIFKHLNIQSPPAGEQGVRARVSYIPNKDGSFRWMWPTDARKPYFLKFYASASFRARVYAFAVKILFFTGLQKLVFKKKVYSFDPFLDNCPIDLLSDNWALFSGTTGPNQKIVAYRETQFGGEFFKVSKNDRSLDLIENEVIAIDRLYPLNIQSFNYPDTCKVSETIVRSEDISEKGRRSTTFNDLHRDVLSELYYKTSFGIKVEDYPLFQQTQEKLKELSQSRDPRLPKGIFRKLDMLLNELKTGEIKVGMAHGDFTPWNMYENEHGLAIYDWELARPLAPVGFDAFHFIIQKGVLIDRKPWLEIREDLEQSISKELFESWTMNSDADHKKYLRFYFLLNTTYYLEIYSQQAEWHEQIYWLLDVWNMALSELLSETQAVYRGLVISDFFDFLGPKDYAAIKFPNVLPELLSEYSDIDLCIEKNDYLEILNYFKRHNLVLQVMEHKKSNMSTLQIFLINGSIINLDLIWKFMRKSVVMMDARKVMQAAAPNRFGVKQMALLDMIHYVGLFYGLNKTVIPSKYQAYEQILAREESKIDKALYGYFIGKSELSQKLRSIVMKSNQNRGFKRLFNVYQYVSDVINQLVFSRGFIITFSGVDGAGKSTILEKTRYEIEKKFRKRTVVLRHRPSLLPILSAWTKGKAEAEKQATETLPRKGENSSLLSSLLRFSYYYLDYFFGQFYVYFRYIRRGYVVLYDRYYFDFISDSRRSNIDLPIFIPKAGYALLMKPQLNFFLYADHHTILKRKQELDSETIMELTESYLNLFRSYETNQENRYITIENRDIDQTLTTIISRTQAKVA